MRWETEQWYDLTCVFKDHSGYRVKNRLQGFEIKWEDQLEGLCSNPREGSVWITIVATKRDDKRLDSGCILKFLSPEQLEEKHYLWQKKGKTARELGLLDTE